MFTWITQAYAGQGQDIAGRIGTYDSEGAINFSSEFIVNYKTSANQSHSQAAYLGSNKVIFIWKSDDSDVDGSNSGISARIATIESNGNIQWGNEFTVNYEVQDYQLAPQVIILNNGKLLFSWHSGDPDIDASGYGISARIGEVQTNGSVSLSNEITVNQNIQGSQSKVQTIQLEDSRILFIWNTYDSNEDSSNEAIAGRIGTLNSDNTITFSNEFTVNEKINLTQSESQVLELPDGRILFTWQSNDSAIDGYSYGISARIGVPNIDGSMSFSNEFTVNQQVEDAQRHSQVTLVNENKVLFTWSSADPDVDGNDGSSDGISARLATLNSDGSISFEDEFTVNLENEFSQEYSEVVMLDNKHILFTWQSYDPDVDGDKYGISARIYTYDAGGFVENQLIPLDINIELGPYAQVNDMYIEISGVPDEAVLTAGDKDAVTGIWTVDYADMDGLQLIPPLNSEWDITISVTGYTLSPQGTVLASEPKTITYVIGDEDAAPIHGTSDHDVIYGTDGNNIIFAGDGDDILSGGNGSDILHGQEGADTFLFETSSAFDAVDQIEDFNVTEGDKLNLSDLLSSYDPLTDLITDFVEITDNGIDSTIKVDVTGTGTFGAGTEIATISDVVGLTDAQSLETSGVLITV